MKCKDCTMDCPYRTSDGEKECEFQNHIIQLPDEWQGVRIQAAIAAMQGTITILGSGDGSAYNAVVVEGYRRNEKTYPKEIAQFAVACADALIKELKKNGKEKET